MTQIIDNNLPYTTNAIRIYSAVQKEEVIVNDANVVIIYIIQKIFTIIKELICIYVLGVLEMLMKKKLIILSL